MPAELLEVAGISCVFSDGRRYRRTVAGVEPAWRWPGDLLAGLAAMVHPHGSVDSPGTVISYLLGLRDMARFMRDRGCRWGRGPAFPGAAGRVLDAGWPPPRVGDPADAGLLRHRPRWAERRSPGSARWPPGGTSRPGRAVPRWSHTTEEEWERLHQACRHDADEAFARHRQALKSAASGQDPRTGGWTAEQAVAADAARPAERRQSAILGRGATWVTRRRRDKGRER